VIFAVEFRSLSGGGDLFPQVLMFVAETLVFS